MPVLPEREAKDITVYVACYNEEDNIIHTLNMLLESFAEAPCSWEVIVIDDASSDRSVEFVEQFISDHPELSIFLVINDENKGLGYNYVDAAFLGRGRYYRLICGDNVEAKDNMVRLLKSMGKADMLITYPLGHGGRSQFRRLLSKAFTISVNLISTYRLRYYNGLAVHLRYNVMRWHGNYQGFGFQADIITRLLDQGASYIEIPVTTQERTSGKSKALTLSNFFSVGHFLIAPGSILRSLLRTFNFEIWKLKCLGACPEDLYSTWEFAESLEFSFSASSAAANPGAR